MTEQNDIKLLEALFEDEGESETFNDHGKEDNQAKYQGKEQDSLDELTSLFDEEHDENQKNPLGKVHLSQMEDQYTKLQEQMKSLKEKISKEKATSPEATGNSQPTIKRSFQEAFTLVSSESQKVICPPNKTVSPPTKTEHCNEPEAKKKRVCHQPIAASHSAVDKKPKSNGFYSSNPSKPAVKKLISEKQSIEIEQYSRIRLKQRLVPASEMQQRMSGKTFVKLSLIRPTLKLAEETDWVTIAVVAKQLDPQTAKNGKPFSIWHLTDLDDCTKHVALFLFGRVHEELWRQITVSSVIGLLNPSIMPPKKEGSGKSYDNIPALTVDFAERVMKLGISSDLGWCMSTKYRNKQPAGKCLAFINKQFGDTCVYHMQSKYKKSSSKRGELQGSVAPPVADKYKKTLWNMVKGDQFFYGGQVFSAAPPSINPNVKKKESKMKLTNFLAPVGTATSAAQKEQLERSKIMQALSGIKGEQKLSGCSDSFAEILSSGDVVAGSRQFLNHLQKKEKEKLEMDKGKPNSFSPKVLLDEQRKLIKQKNQNLKRQVEKASSINFVSAETIKKCTQELVNKQKSHAAKPTIRNSLLSQNLPALPQPKLGKSASEESSVDISFNWLSAKSALRSSSRPVMTLEEIKKKRALAKLRNENGNVEIRKSNPNRGVIGRLNEVKGSAKLKEKLLEKVKENRQEVSEEKKEKENLRTAFHQTMSEEEFKKILNATSSHSVELELAEMERQEKYFNPLIRKEMMEEKMASTFELPAKVATCQQCNYTFWAPHERCKQLQHSVTWKNVKKRFFECTNCKQRTICWDPYPAKACRECGSAQKWKRTCMLKSKDLKLDNELLLIRGIEHAQFLNALK